MSVSELEFSTYVKNSETTSLLTEAALSAGFLRDIFDCRQECMERALHAINAANIESIKDLDTSIVENIEKIKLFLKVLQKHRLQEKIDGWRVWIEFIYEMAVVTIKPEIFTHEYQQQNGYVSTVALIVEKSIKDIADA